MFSKKKINRIWAYIFKILNGNNEWVTEANSVVMCVCGRTGINASYLHVAREKTRSLTTNTKSLSKAR